MLKHYVKVSKISLLSADTLIQSCPSEEKKFESKEFLNFCKERDILKLRTTSYNPKGNFKSKIFSVLTEKSMDRNSWSRWVDLVLYDYRFTVHATTGFRPVDLFFSFCCRGALLFQAPKDTATAPFRMQRSRYQKKKFYDRKLSTKARFFNEGEQVLLRNSFKSSFSSKGVVVTVVEHISR